MKTLFIKQELADYVKERGYTANIEDMWDYYVKTEFKYVQGQLRIKLVNWKNDVNLKLRNGKFNAMLIPKPKPPPEPQPDFVPVSMEKRAEIKAGMKRIGKKPDYGFRSTKVLEQKRQQAIKKLKDVEQ